MTDEEDDGLLIGNAAPLAPPIIPCSGMHPTVPLFAHNTSCAHALDVHAGTVCGGVLITDPSNLAMYGGANDVNDINIPIPTVSLANAVANKTVDDPAGRKKVQFQSVQHPPATASSQSYHIAQFASSSHPELLQRASSPATFVLPVSMATPHLGDLYCHGTAIAYNANFSTSMDSTASYNSTSCASCNYALQQGAGVQPETCASQTGSLDRAPIGGTDPSTDSRSSSLKAQQSVESIWIELPSRFHIRSNSTPSEDINLTTVVYNTPTGSAMNRHSPLTEEPFSGDESMQESMRESNRGLIRESKRTDARFAKVARSKSDEFVRSTTKATRKSRSLELQGHGWPIDESTNEPVGVPRKVAEERTPTSGRSSRSRPHYHSVDNIDHNLPHSTPHIQRYSSAGLLAKALSSIDRTSVEQLARPTKAELLVKRKRKPVELLRKEHYKSDNLILKSRHKLRELSEEFRSSLTHRAHPFRPLQRSLTESETSSCLTRSLASCSSSSERINRTKPTCSRARTAARKRPKKEADLVQLVGRKSLSTTDSTDNETDRTSQRRTTGYYASSGSHRTRQASTTITIQSSESSFEFERLDEQQVPNRLDSIRERARDSADQLCGQTNLTGIQQASSQKPTSQPTSKFKIYQSATMYNLSSTFDEPTELLISDLSELADQRPMRRHQSAEQMLKRIIRNVHDYYRKQFKS